MRNLKRALVLTMFICLISSCTLFALGQESIELVPWEKLADFIIEISGWVKKGILEGIKVEVPTKSEVWQGYVSETGKRSLEINILDSAESMIILMPIKMMMRNGKTDQGYSEKITINGFPGVKTYDYLNKEAVLIVLILDRFALQMFGKNFTAEEVPELEAIAELHNLNEMVNLVK